MHVANIELCKQLFELSEWENYPCYWSMRAVGKYASTVLSKHSPKLRKRIENGLNTPAYDLGYLLRKLPRQLVIKTRIYTFILTPSTSDGSWSADYFSGRFEYYDGERNSERWLHNGNRARPTEADTPENAAAMLAIQLFKEGILKKGEV